MSVLENTFQARLLAEINAPARDTRVERQNVGSVAVRDEEGELQRFFHAGPKAGAGDLSGIVRPEGWRLEVEAKAAETRVRVAQKRRAKFIEAWGGVYVQCRYQAGRTMDENVASAILQIDAAIEARRFSR